MAQTANDFGTGVSPMIADGTVVLLRDQKKDPKIVAVDLATGSLKWEKKRQGPSSSFCTPTIWDTPDGKQIVAPGYGSMIGYDLQIGRGKVVGAGHAVRVLRVSARDRKASCSLPPGRPAMRRTSEFKMPTFDDLLKQGDANHDGSISRKESEKTFLQRLFRQQRHEPRRQAHPRRVGRQHEVHVAVEEQRLRAEAPAARAT